MKPRRVLENPAVAGRTSAKRNGRPRSEQQRRSKGFTLLEVVVALAVTVTAVVVLQRAVADALRARGMLASDVQRRGGTSAALVHLVHELGGAVPGTLRIEPASGQSPALLEFAVDEPAPVIVRYRVVEHRLERSVQLRFALGDAGDPTVMLSDVSALAVRGRDADGWHARWEDTHPPSLVALDLELGSGERFATLVPLLAGAQP
jgi:prepilin-type N-terminal cleavage/methylation domain-containing protein